MSHLFWYPGHERPLKHIARVENCYLYDVAGNRFVDMKSGGWCMSLGHSHPEVLKVLSAQAARIAHTGYCYSNDIVEAAARDVMDPHGFTDGKCVFLCSGSEAVEFSVRA